MDINPMIDQAVQQLLQGARGQSLTRMKQKRQTDEEEAVDNDLEEALEDREQPPEE